MVTHGNEALLEISGGIAVISINRPKFLNSVSDITMREIESALNAVEDDENVKVVIITGVGDKAFCAGRDISGFADASQEEIRELALYAHSVCDKIQGFPKPVIAAVNGVAFGAGCELACACDFRIATEFARFGLPEVSLGIIPGMGGTQRLPRLIGPGPAKYYTITNEHIIAPRALELGLVEKVVPITELMPVCKAIAAKIMRNSSSAVRIARSAINRGSDVELSAGILIEVDSFIEAYYTPDRQEGVAAFLEKRRPKFQ